VEIGVGSQVFGLLFGFLGFAYRLAFACRLARKRERALWLYSEKRGVVVIWVF
jgi:hypothetical protein